MEINGSAILKFQLCPAQKKRCPHLIPARMYKSQGPFLAPFSPFLPNSASEVWDWTPPPLSGCHPSWRWVKAAGLTK